MKLISTQYDFITFSCSMQGNVLYSRDKSIQVVCQDRIDKQAEQIIPLYEQYGCDCINWGVSVC